MRQINVFSLGAPPAFSVSPAADNYWLMRLCHEESVDRYNRQQAGFIEYQQESSDFDTILADVNAFKSGFQAWLSDLTMPDDGSDPQTRGVPANVNPPSWSALLSRIVALVASGSVGGVPAVLATLAIDVALNVGTDIFSKWLAGKVYPADGGLNELVKAFRKSFLIDPGVADFERSVFVGEKDGTGLWGLFEGDFISLGQALYEALTFKKEGETYPLLESALLSGDKAALLHLLSEWRLSVKNLGGDIDIYNNGANTDAEP